MIKAGKKADWTVTSFNNSTTELSGYEIIDTLDLPLQFEGKFNYYMYGFDNNGSESWYVSAGGKPENADSYLFEITRNGDNIIVTSNTGDLQNLTMGGDAVTLKAKTVCNKNLEEDVRAEFTVKISHDDEKHEILTIGFPDKKWDMLPNSCSELTFSTPSGAGKDEKNEDKIEPGTYTNTAMFSPNDKNYDDTITQGRLVKDKEDNNVGVDHSAVVSIYTGNPSGSVKMIEEKSDSTNFTTSEREDNYIRLLNKKDLFTYTLEVRNLDNESSMENLVIIDNLPQQNDATTLRQESKRESEFKVDLAKVGNEIKPNVEVWLYTDAKKLNASDRSTVSPAVKYQKDTDYTVLKLGEDYTVEYSEKQKDFNNNDWEGKEDNISNWSNVPTENTRSIRIHFKDKEITQNQVIQIRFDAQIRDDDDAKPGKIAWNTFGYSYNTGELVAKASPNKVGICIPGCPTLTKKVVDSEGKESKVSKNSTFEFIIYKSNETIEFENYTAETVAKTLNEKNIDFMYQKLEVEAGKSESNELPLENFLKFDYNGDDGFKKFDEKLPNTFWKTDETYHIVELDTNKEDYCYKSTNEENNNNYSFKIDLTNNTLLEFVNENLQAHVELPETGGNGTGMFVFSGLMMICLSAFLLLRNKRKHTQK